MKLSDRMVDTAVSHLQAQVRDLFPDTKADWLDHMFAPPIRLAVEGVLLQARLEWEREHPSARQSEALAWALGWIKETGEVPIAEETEPAGEYLSAVESLEAATDEIAKSRETLTEAADFLDGLTETHASRLASSLRQLSQPTPASLGEGREPEAWTKFSDDPKRWRPCGGEGGAQAQYRNDHGHWVGTAPEECPPSLRSWLYPDSNQKGQS